MKINITYSLLIALALFLSLAENRAVAQCDPMTAEQCPDPENNGEICPDTLAVGFLGVLYSQVATILAPGQDTAGISLHHITLSAIDNLPPGITWQTNAANNEFYPNIYSCILLEGTPDSAAIYNLKIVVDIYISLFGFPIYATTITDSTSLTMEIVDASGLADNGTNDLFITGNYPNPFSSITRINYYCSEPGQVSLKIYSLLGEEIYNESMMSARGENYFVYKNDNLQKGPYFYVLNKDGHTASGIIIHN